MMLSAMPRPSYNSDTPLIRHSDISISLYLRLPSQHFLTRPTPYARTAAFIIVIPSTTNMHILSTAFKHYSTIANAAQP